MYPFPRHFFKLKTKLVTMILPNLVYNLALYNIQMNTPYIGALVFILVPWYCCWCHGFLIGSMVFFIGAMVFLLVPWYFFCAIVLILVPVYSYWCHGIYISAYKCKVIFIAAMVYI